MLISSKKHTHTHTIGSFLLEYAFIHPDLLPFVITQLATVLASLTLLGWAEVEQYKDVHKDILQFIQVKTRKRKSTVQINSMLLLFFLLGIH